MGSYFWLQFWISGLHFGPNLESLKQLQLPTIAILQMGVKEEHEQRSHNSPADLKAKKKVIFKAWFKSR